MNSRQRLLTIAWCAVTMVATMLLSHGHLVMREVMQHWPTAESWEGRFENALYTQGGLMFLASLTLGTAMMVRSYIVKLKDEEIARRERVQREQHERSAASRHEALLERLGTLNGSSPPKKSQASGVRPR